MTILNLSSNIVTKLVKCVSRTIGFRTSPQIVTVHWFPCPKTHTKQTQNVVNKMIEYIYIIIYTLVSYFIQSPVIWWGDGALPGVSYGVDCGWRWWMKCLERCPLLVSRRSDHVAAKQDVSSRHVGLFQDASSTGTRTQATSAHVHTRRLWIHESHIIIPVLQDPTPGYITWTGTVRTNACQSPWLGQDLAKTQITIRSTIDPLQTSTF